LSGTPSVIGWYPASIDRDPSARRHWNGVAWSAPVYVGDPLEHWISAKGRPAEFVPGEEVVWQNDEAASEQCERWIRQACSDRFVETQYVTTPEQSGATAPSLLEAAAGHIRARASTYDKPEGERSMAATVQAFNAITGHVVSESEGWLFMELLKAVRDYTTKGGHADSQEDRIAYAALGAEARRAGR
jgi:hypothetical protein